MRTLLVLATIVLMWDDPDNPVGTVAGYNVYRVEHPGTGEMIRHKLNAELVPWQPDTDTTPEFLIPNVQTGQEFRVTAVGPEGDEGEISDDFYVVPAAPVAVGWRIASP